MTTTTRTLPAEAKTAIAGWQPSRHVWMLARLTLREAWRRRLLWIAIGLGAAFQVLFAVGFSSIYNNEIVNNGMDPNGPSMQTGITMMLVMGLYAVNFLIIMTTVLTTVGSVSQEISTNTIHAVAAKPLRRWEIFLGKWVGHAIMVAGYALVMATGVFLTTFFVTGSMSGNVGEALGLMVLGGLVVMSVSLMGSTLFSTLANGVVVFMLYGLALIGALMEQIGAVFESRLVVDIGIFTSLLLPGEALWRRVAYDLQSPMARSLSQASPFGTSSVPSPVFIIYALFYVVVMTVVGMRIFTRRDF